MTAPTIRPSGGFTPDEKEVLEYLGRWDDATPNQIAVRFSLTKEEAQRLLTAMVRRGLIRRVRKGVYAGNEGEGNRVEAK